jgi:hypothetical protein
MIFLTRKVAIPEDTSSIRLLLMSNARSDRRKSKYVCYFVSSWMVALRSDRTLRQQFSVVIFGRWRSSERTTSGIMHAVPEPITTAFLVLWLYFCSMGVRLYLQNDRPTQKVIEDALISSFMSITSLVFIVASYLYDGTYTLNTFRSMIESKSIANED